MLLNSLQGREPTLPQSLALAGGELHLKRWLRVLPDKRYVAEAVWCSKGVERRVLAKIYLGARSDKKMRAELSGSERLRQAQLPTPAVIANGTAEGAAWLLLEWLDSAETLAQRLALAVDDVSHLHAAPGEDMFEALSLLRQLHRADLAQADVHPDNFLYAAKRWYLIDTAEITPARRLQDRQQNLAKFLAQLPHSYWSTLLESCADDYGVSGDFEPLFNLARGHRLWRARDLAAKSVRDCTLFRCRANLRQLVSVWRSEAEVLQPLLDDVEAVMAAGEMLKDGGSATVVRVNWQGRNLVIKRYNVKGLGHFLKRCWRPSRALHSWQQAHLWRVLELPTPRPLAVIERRIAGLRAGGYLITECALGEDIIAGFSRADEAELASAVAELEQLLARMASYRLSHGDLKGTNVLHSGQSLSFIDLDAACCHVNVSKWVKAFARDLARLTRNWSAQSAVAQTITAMCERLKY